MSLNKAMLIGNVGKDPEVRYLENSSPNNAAKVASFPLATSERYKDRNGELHENTEWHNIVVWRGLADVVEKFVKKGTQVYIEGRIRTRSWTDQTGNKRYTTEIVADSLQLLGKRGDGQDQPGQPSYAPQQPAQQTYAPQPQTSYAPQAPAGFAPQAAPAGFAPQQPAAPQEDEGDDLPF